MGTVSAWQAPAGAVVTWSTQLGWVAVVERIAASPHLDHDAAAFRKV